MEIALQFNLNCSIVVASLLNLIMEFLSAGCKYVWFLIGWNVWVNLILTFLKRLCLEFIF